MSLVLRSLDVAAAGAQTDKARVSLDPSHGHLPRTLPLRDFPLEEPHFRPSSGSCGSPFRWGAVSNPTSPMPYRMTDIDTRRIHNILPPSQVLSLSPTTKSMDIRTDSVIASAILELDRPLVVFDASEGLGREGMTISQSCQGGDDEEGLENGGGGTGAVVGEEEDHQEETHIPISADGDPTDPSPPGRRLPSSVITAIVLHVSAQSSDHERCETLPPLCLVSKRWLTPARKELYSAPLSLFSRRCTFPKAQRLLQSIETQSNVNGLGRGTRGGNGEGGKEKEKEGDRRVLGNYVKTLAWLGYWTARFMSRLANAEPSVQNTVNEWAVRMIAACPKVQCLTLPLGRSIDRSRLLASVKQMRGLETLIIDRQAEEDLESSDPAPKVLTPVGMEDLGQLNEPPRPPIKELIIRSSLFSPRVNTIGISWRLQSLCLYDVRLDEFNILVLLWGSHETLRKLELVRCSKLSTSESNRGSGLKHILGRLGPNLKELRIVRQSITDQPPTEPMTELETICTRCPSLEVLSVGGDLLLTDGLFRKLGITNTKLRSLRMALRPSEYASAVPLVKDRIYPPENAIRQIPCPYQITARDFCSALLLGERECFPSLRSLDMSWIGWDPQDAESVVEAGRLRGIDVNVSISIGGPAAIHAAGKSYTGHSFPPGSNPGVGAGTTGAVS